MRHNLPTPSQAWGTDIDRRVAKLEDNLRRLENLAGNSSSTLNTLVSDKAINGVAQPFVINDHRTNLIVSSDSNSYDNLIWSYPLDWGVSSSYMIVSLSGYVQLHVSDNYGAKISDSVIRSGITGGTSQGRNSASIGIIDGSRMFIAPITSTTVVKYTDNINPTASVSISNSSLLNNVINGSDRSYITVTISGVRY